MQTFDGIVCGVFFVGFIVFALRQGMKVTPDGSGNGTNGGNMQQGG